MDPGNYNKTEDRGGWLGDPHDPKAADSWGLQATTADSPVKGVRMVLYRRGVEIANLSLSAEEMEHVGMALLTEINDHFGGTTIKQ